MPTAAPAATIRVLIVGAHALTRAAIACLLQVSCDDVAVSGQADQLPPRLEHPADSGATVILLALDCPEDHARFRRPAGTGMDGPPVVVIADDDDPRLFRRAIQLGAAGIVLKSDTPDTLLKAIRKTAAGEMWIRRSQMADALRSARAGGGNDEASRQIGSLTRREREIVLLVADGLGNRVIAERLFISEATVRNHLTSILDKLQLRNRSELVAFAFRRGLVHG